MTFPCATILVLDDRKEVLRLLGSSMHDVKQLSLEGRRDVQMRREVNIEHLTRYKYL